MTNFLTQTDCLGMKNVGPLDSVLSISDTKPPGKKGQYCEKIPNEGSICCAKCDRFTGIDRLCDSAKDR